MKKEYNSQRRQFLVNAGKAGLAAGLTASVLPSWATESDSTEFRINAEDIPYTQQPLLYKYNALEPSIDAMTMEISNDNGTTWVQCAGIADQKNFWTTKTIRVGSWVTPTNQVRIRFNCSDNPNNSLTEAAIDWVQVQRISP